MKKTRWRLLFFVIILLISTMAVPYSSVEGDDDFIELKENDRGDDVIMLQLRLRDLGYYNYKITNVFGSFTREALKNFQGVNGLSRDGILGAKTNEVLYSNAAKRKPVEEVVKPTPKPTRRPSSSSSGSSSSSSSSSGSSGSSDSGNYDVKVDYTGQTGALRDWFTYVNQRFSRSEKIKVYAVDSGITFYVKRLGGSNHADVEPCTPADTAAFKKAHGNEWNWNRMAVVVTIGGEDIAASMNGQPHSVYNIKDNNFPGHCCMHFLNSRTHNTNAVDSKHQDMVMRAAGQ